VSFDPPHRNRTFAHTYRFGYPLLTASYDLGRVYGTKRDDDEEWADVPRRLSYLIDPAGRIRKAYRVLDPSQHPEQVLRDLHALREPPRGRLRSLLTRS
jgi:peroxiredoxin Q/BCP